MNQSTPSVRIGPISLFALIAVICLATLAVLSINTARASLNLAQMQAESTTQQYAAESAAQEFVAQVSAGGTAPSAASLASITSQVQANNAGVTITSGITGPAVTAQFACPSGRILDIAVEVGQGGSYRITKWNMTAKVNEAEGDILWSGM